MVLLIILSLLTMGGCVHSIRAFRRADASALLVQAVRDGVLYHYPTQRPGTLARSSPRRAACPKRPEPRAAQVPASTPSR